MRRVILAFASCCGLSVLCGCSTTDSYFLTKPQSIAWNVDPSVPQAVRTPPGHVLLGHAIGRGLETFTMQPDPANPARNVWTPTLDEGGDLLDDDGQIIGHHEGTSWAMHDGGQVSADLIALVPQTNRPGIALYQAISHEGGGLMGSAEFIEQRHPVGGPPMALNNSPAGSKFRAEYSIDYYFYGSTAPQTRSNRGGAYLGP